MSAQSHLQNEANFTEIAARADWDTKSIALIAIGNPTPASFLRHIVILTRACEL
jgi:hypothetical protein